MSMAKQGAVVRYGIVPLAGASAVTLALMLFDVTPPAHVVPTLARSFVYACAITVLAGLTLPGLRYLCARAGTRGVAARTLVTATVALVCAVGGTAAGGAILVLLGLDTGEDFWTAFRFSVRISLVMTFTMSFAMLGYEAFRDRLERVDRLRRFFSAPLADLIVSGRGDDPLRSHRREVTVVFLDLRRFTAFAEAAEPEEIMWVLHEYHAAVGTLVLRWAGTLERFTGDGMMIVFNDPVPVENPAERAVRMALEMREGLERLRTTWRTRGYDLDFGIGIAQGHATVGLIGFEGRVDYGVIGTVTNLASRLCGEATAGQILVSPPVHAAIDGLVEAEGVGDLALRGFSKPVRAFNIVRLARHPIEMSAHLRVSSTTASRASDRQSARLASAPLRPWIPGSRGASRA